jgi:hypothetical protein
MNQRTIGESTLNEMLPYLKQVADVYGLKLYRVKEFRMARIILANLYSSSLL